MFKVFDRISEFFFYRSRLWYVGVLFLLIVALFMVLPITESFFQIGEGMISLDKPNWHSPDDIHKILGSWGDSGRMGQFWLHMTWDLALPVTYFFFLGFLLSYFTRKGFPPESSMHKMNLVSLVAVVDILENAMLFILIVAFPSELVVVGVIKTALTLIKYYLFGPVILLAFAISIGAALRMIVKI